MFHSYSRDIFQIHPSLLGDAPTLFIVEEAVADDGAGVEVDDTFAVLTVMADGSVNAEC